MANRNEDQADITGELSDSTEEKSLLTRRTYLKAANTAVAAVAATGLTGSATASGSYETIRLAPGESREFHVGSGETFENKLIDISATDAEAYVTASGSGWTIRNVGFRGRNDLHKLDGTRNVWALIHPEGDGHIENAYLGDGCVDGAQRSAIGFRKDHAGHVTIRNCYVAEWADNGVYAANVAEGGGGSVDVADSYFRDNNIGHVRLASDGDVAKRCVVHNTGNVPTLADGRVGSYGVYTGYGTADDVVEIQNCQVDVHDGNTNGLAYAFNSNDQWTDADMSTIRVTTPDYRGDVMGPYVDIDGTNRSDPETTAPSGVPTDPEMAARGGPTASTTDSLVIETNEGGPLVGYEFTVDGSVTKGDTAEGNDDVSSDGDTSTVTGVTGNGYDDTYEVDGKLLDWSATVSDEHYSLLRNGDEIDPTASLPETLTIETNRGGPLVEYEFTIEGTVLKGDAEQNDSVSTDGDTTRVTGVTGNGYTDSYRFEGTLVDWQAAVPKSAYSLTLNGDEIDPLQYSDPRTLTIETNRGGPLVLYEFTVAGTVTRGDHAESGYNIASDSITDSTDGVTVSGATGNGFTDDFEIEGSLVDWQASADADEYRVVIDGEEIDPTSL